MSLLLTPNLLLLRTFQVLAITIKGNLNQFNLLANSHHTMELQWQTNHIQDQLAIHSSHLVDICNQTSHLKWVGTHLELATHLHNTEECHRQLALTQEQVINLQVAGCLNLISQITWVSSTECHQGTSHLDNDKLNE